METITRVLEEFLEEQEARLGPATYRGYEYTVDLFRAYLNGYAYQYLDGDESELFDRLYNEEDREFCEIFGPDTIGTSMISEFLDYFMIRKVMCSKTFMRTTGTVMRRLVGWMHERGHIF